LKEREMAILVNYQDMIEEAQWLHLAEKGKAQLNTEVSLKGEGLSEITI
jgi:hypothetical protein